MKVSLCSALFLGATLALGSCTTTPQEHSDPTPENTTLGSSLIDINPHDPESLRDGGDFRLAVDQLPDNWNFYELDGPTGDGYKMISTILPILWEQTAEGTVRPNTDYLISAEMTSSSPQTVEYTLDPHARWSTGQQIGWRDFAAQADALNGDRRGYKTAATAGYEDIAQVGPGNADNQVEVTFSRPFAEWQTLFTPLYPASVFATAKEFNVGWLRAPRVTAGPFRIQTIDQGSSTVKVTRDPGWWGTRPRLQTITFQVLPLDDLPGAISAGRIDAYPIGSNTELLRQSEHLDQVEIRNASAPDYATLCFNGAPGRILADRRLRLAIQHGINVHDVITAALGDDAPPPPPLGNHFFLHESANYVDHSAIAGFDPQMARDQLDDIGWKLRGDVRFRNGEPLEVHLVIREGSASSSLIATAVQKDLAEIGVRIVIDTAPSADYFAQYVNPGNFDLSTFRWVVTALPITSSQGVYYLDPRNVNENYGKIGSPAVNRLFRSAVAELDPDSRIAVAQQIDEEVWKSGSQLPLYQTPGTVAVRSGVANFGAAGYASMPYDWPAVGFIS